MKSSVEDAIKQIPDFEEFLNLAQEIRGLTLQKLLIEKKLKEKESEIFREAMNNEKYFNNGKQPAVSYVESAYKFSGFDGELLPAREELARVTAELDYARLTYDTYKLMIGVFQTLSANERGTTF